MVKGVLIHRSDSRYDDVPSSRYQFPSRYLKAAESFQNDWVVFLEPRRAKNARGYFAVAKVLTIQDDPAENGMYRAIMAPGTYLDFGSPVPFGLPDGPAETGLLNEKGTLSGRKQAAVRQLSDADFARIVDLGLADEKQILPRDDPGHFAGRYGLAETRATFKDALLADRLTVLTSRKIRDANFRKVVLRAYQERCAITGLRLINGGGRAEVQAAHIRPVMANGPDIVSNGLALSGTAHWMFDRGIIGIAEDMKILVSRQTNDPASVEALINPTGQLIFPDNPAHRPNPVFTNWHLEECFKH